MRRAPRLLVTLLTALTLATPSTVAAADAGPAPEAAVALPAAAVATPEAVTPGVDAELDLAELPVDAVEVTETDTSLKRTSNEVTVMVTTEDGPEVHKLRTDSAADQAELAAHLDAQPGVVAAPTATLRALELPLPALPEPMAGEQWNLPMVGVGEAWRYSQGAGVIVAVVDTGVDGTHPDLIDRMLPEIDLLPEVMPAPIDNAHGTRVASIIAGSLNGIGMAGVAPQAQILPVAALDPSGVGDSATVAAAIIRAADAGARVINLSLGGPDADRILDSACAYAFSRGAVLVAAAGNSYLEGNQVQYPAASPNVVAVASVDATGTPSGFSNTGPHIDLAAPGQDVPAAFPGATYDRQSGTSFATPHVAGAMALVIAANPALSAAQVVSVTELTAQDDASGNGRDEQLGYGIVRADRAAATALSMTAAPVAADARLRLKAFDASPEPVRRRHVATVRVQVQALYPDGFWRANPLPALVRFEFKPSGTKRYRFVADVASGVDGMAVLQVLPNRTGTWRAKVRQVDGSWKASKVDRQRVRR